MGVAACGPVAAPPETETNPRVQPVFESPYFTVTVTGTGPSVILVPGLASNAAIWDGTVAAFESEYTLHVVQVSGFGGAPARGNDGNTNILDDLSDDLARYASSLSEPPALVGHSLGGLVSLKTALNPDARLDRLVIIDVLPFFSVLMDSQTSADAMRPIAAMMKATLLAQPAETFASSQDTALAALVKGEDHRQLALDWSVRSDRSVMAQAMSEVLVTDLRSEIGNIRIPTTVVFARDEAIPNMADVEAFYRDLYAPLDDGLLIPIDQAFHFIMFDQPNAFNRAFQDGLKR